MKKLTFILIALMIVAITAPVSASANNIHNAGKSPVVSYPTEKPTESTFTFKVTKAMPCRFVWIKYGLTPSMTQTSKKVVANRRGEAQFTITMKYTYEYSKSVYYKACTARGCGEYKVAHLLVPLTPPWSL